MHYAINEFCGHDDGGVHGFHGHDDGASDFFLVNVHYKSPDEGSFHFWCAYHSFEWILSMSHAGNENLGDFG